MEKQTTSMAPKPVAPRASSRRKKTTPPSIVMLVMISFISGVLGAGVYGYATRSTPVANLVAQNKQVTLQENSATIDLVKKVGASVVSINTSSRVQGIFGLNQNQQGAGTGMIVTSDGLILTNKHVVEGASSFTVTLTDGKQYDGKLVATDPSNDVAYLRVQATGLQAAELGDSDKVEVGQKVVAIGNALGQFANTVTTGVISGKSRPIEASDGSGGTERLSNLFQTDAAINPGNSGGPLLNIDGQVIGINTAIAGQNAQNIGFAIPINEVKSTLDTVKNTGKIERPYLGVRYVMLTQSFAERNNLPVKEGALLRGDDQTIAVISNSPAQKAGLREGDILTKIGDKDVNTKSPLSSVIVQFKVGQSLEVKYYRDGKEQTAKVTLEASPSNQQ